MAGRRPERCGDLGLARQSATTTASAALRRAASRTSSVAEHVPGVDRRWSPWRNALTTPRSNSGPVPPEARHRFLLGTAHEPPPTFGRLVAESRLVGPYDRHRERVLLAVEVRHRVPRRTAQDTQARTRNAATALAHRCDCTPSGGAGPRSTSSSAPPRRPPPRHRHARRARTTCAPGRRGARRGRAAPLPVFGRELFSPCARRTLRPPPLEPRLVASHLSQRTSSRSRLSVRWSESQRRLWKTVSITPAAAAARRRRGPGRREAPAAFRPPRRGLPPRPPIARAAWVQSCSPRTTRSCSAARAHTSSAPSTTRAAGSRARAPCRRSGSAVTIVVSSSPGVAAINGRGRPAPKAVAEQDDTKSGDRPVVTTDAGALRRRPARSRRKEAPVSGRRWCFAATRRRWSLPR